MKSAPYQYILTFLGAIIGVLLSLALGFIEIRALIEGIYVLYENQVAQFLRLIFRFMMMLLLLANAIIGIIVLWKKGNLVTVSLSLGFGAAFIGILCFLFYEWYIALALTLSALMIVASSIIPLTRQRFFLESED